MQLAILIVVGVAVVLLVINLILLCCVSASSRREISRQLAESSATDRQELAANFSVNRAEISGKFNEQGETIKKSFNDFMDFLRKSAQTEMDFRDKFQTKVDELRHSIDERLRTIQEESTKRLDEMKKTVDEKLQESVEKRFNESFKLISERLEQVHKGLGEMQSLATGVGDLRKILTNVKTRGNIGEFQLATILEQYLSADQYSRNIATVVGSRELVEFAVKFPGQNANACVYLPIDSKFPVEDYRRLLQAYEDFPRLSKEVKDAQNSFIASVKNCAKQIGKYLNPPTTTAFALMFVPSEGVYAEVLRQEGLFEELQAKYHICVVGPANLVAFLNALQMGFRTIALEKRSSEVWEVLGAVKTEFGKFGDAMDAMRKSLTSVVNHADKIGTRSRALERTLKSVQEIPAERAQTLLPDLDVVPGDNSPDSLNL